jgi:hypothetical protein
MPVFDHFADVVRLDATDPRATVCGTCGAAWDDSVSTSVTPVPAGRCPFEYEHPELSNAAPVTMVEVVEFLQNLANEINEWNIDNEDPDPWVISEMLETFAEDIWSRNRLSTEV